MSKLQIILLALTCSSLVLTSLLGMRLHTALRAWKALQKTLESRSTRSLMQLDAEVAELASSFGSLSLTVKRLSSRIGMQDVRERQRAGRNSTSSFGTTSRGQLDLEGLSPAERKAALRKGLAEGTLRAIRDDGTSIKEV